MYIYALINSDAHILQSALGNSFVFCNMFFPTGKGVLSISLVRRATRVVHWMMFDVICPGHKAFSALMASVRSRRILFPVVLNPIDN